MHLLAAISHHGLGHLAQAAPVLNRLMGLQPGLRLTVHSGLSQRALAARIHVPFSHIEEAVDCGMAMHDALRVDREASLDCYRAFHRDWGARVQRQAGHLREWAVDAVLSDVAYLPLAAARAAGIRSAAMCSLNWADIAEAYLGQEPGMAEAIAQMRLAYRDADCFLRLEPAMPMADMANSVAMPPVAAQGVNRRGELLARFDLPGTQRLVLLGMGGIAYRGAVASWPVGRGIAWLAPAAWCQENPGCLALDDLDMPFIDLLASVDALITKPGYGSFVEAAAHGVPVLYLDRPDWPESPYLRQWLHAHGRAAEITEAELAGPVLIEKLEMLWSKPGLPRLADGGVELTARHLADWLQA